MAFGVIPIPPLASPGPVGPFNEIRGHPAHDKLWRFGGKPRVSPPTQTALDIRIQIGGSATIILSEHPGAKQARLETIPRVFLQQRPGGHIHGETGVVGLINFLVRDDQVSRHLRFLDLIGGAEQR